MEDERNNEAQRPLTHQNPKRHIPLVSLLLWRKIMAVHPFVWALGLRLGSVSEAVTPPQILLDLLTLLSLQTSKEIM